VNFLELLKVLTEKLSTEVNTPLRAYSSSADEDDIEIKKALKASILTFNTENQVLINLSQ